MKKRIHIATPKSVTEPATDGRLRRSVVTRERIINAAFDLILEGCVAPTGKQLAARAGTTLRTLFRQFNDMDSLYSEMTQVLDGMLTPSLPPRMVGDIWQKRLIDSLDLRAELYERLSLIHLASIARRHESIVIQTNMQLATKRQRQSLRRLLPPELAKDENLFEALDQAMSIEAWIRLRSQQGLSAFKARKTMIYSMYALLERAGVVMPK